MNLFPRSLLLLQALVLAMCAVAPVRAALLSCDGPFFVDAIAEPAWVNIDIFPASGTNGIRQALATARDAYPDQPVRIRLAPGVYEDNVGAEIYAQRLLRSATNPIYLQAIDPAPDATQLGHGLNLLGVSYIAIDGLTFGPATVGDWNGTQHAPPLPLLAAAGIHVAGAAKNGNANANSGGILNSAIYGQYEPSHHVLIRSVTIQNLFDPADFDAETAQGFGADGIKFNQAEDVWVIDSRISQTTRHGIDNVGVHRAAFCRNVVAHNGGGLGIEAKGGSTDVLYDSNVFYRVRRVELGGENTDATYYFSLDGRWDYEALGTVARNNLIIDPREAALEFSGCADCFAIGNSILFTSAYVPPLDGTEVTGGDAIRVHDSMTLGVSDGAGNDCQTWDANIGDYVTVDPCWGVGASDPAPINRVLRTTGATVQNNLFAAAGGHFGRRYGGSTMACPLNVIDGNATLLFRANYWWNGTSALPAEGCSALPVDTASIGAGGEVTASPLLAETLLDTVSLTSLAQTAALALTPGPNSPLAGRALAHAMAGATDARQHQRAEVPTIGAIEAVALVIEFYNPDLDHYFITADANEALFIDSGGAGRWIRTDYTFNSGGSASVCRFYGSQSPGPNSHFYTVDSAECQFLRDMQFPTGDPRILTDKSWNFESLDFVSTPPASGACPTGTEPVYRAYNNGYSLGIDSNHRIISSLAAISEVVARGWSYEGVVMCAPQ